MALNDTEQALVDYYQKKNPQRFAGHDPQIILNYAKQKDPQFEQRYQALWNTTSPIGRAGTAVGDAIRDSEDYASKTIQGADGWLSNVPGLEATKNVATDLVGPVGDSYKYIGDKLQEYGSKSDDSSLVGATAKFVGDIMSQSSDSAEAMTHPDELAVLGAGLGVASNAGEIAASAGRALPDIGIKPSVGAHTFPVSSFPEEALSPTQGPKPPVNFGPQGLADKVKPPVAEEPSLTARELATATGISTPGAHGLAAQNIVKADMAGMHDFASAPWQSLSRQGGDFFEQGKAISGTPDTLVKSIEPFKDSFESLPKELQTGTMKKYLKAATGPDENEAANQSIDKIKGEHVDPKDEGILTLNGMVELRKQLGSLYGKNKGTPTGAFASAAIDGLDKDIEGMAPTEYKKTLQDARSRWKLYKDTYDNDHVNGLLKAGSADAHDILMGGKRGSAEAVSAIQAAGGEDAIRNLQKSHMYDLFGKVVGAPSSEKTFLTYQYEHQDAMNQLYSRAHQDELHGLSKVIDKQKMDYESAVERNKTSEKSAADLAAGNTVTPESEPPTKVSIATKQETALEKSPFWRGAKNLASVTYPQAEGAMNIVERLLRAKRGIINGK